MEIKMNVFDYLSEDEVKEIVMEEVKSSVHECVSKMFKDEDEIARILTNSSYSCVQSEVDKLVPDYKDKIASGVKKLIDGNNYHYEVFYHDDYTNRDTLGMKYLNEVVTNNKDKIKERVETAISEYDVTKLIENSFGDTVNNVAGKLEDVSDLLYKLANK